MKKEIFITEKYERIRVRQIRREIPNSPCWKCSQNQEWLTVDEAAELFQTDSENISTDLLKLRRDHQSQKDR